MNTTPDDAMFIVRTAWQRLRADYLSLVDRQKAGKRADFTMLARSFVDMNNALEAAMSTTQPAPLDEIPPKP